MEDCWQDKPHARPSTTDIMNVMRDPSFLCLEDVIPFDGGSEGCIYSNSSQVSLYECDASYSIVRVGVSDELINMSSRDCIALIGF